jgi:large subunit ribosomal protein L35
MPKNKPCKGLLKRIRFTKSGKVKFRRAFGRHLRSHKSRALKREYRQPTFAKTCDLKRIQGMLHRRVTAGGSDRPASTGEGGSE